MPTSKPTKPTNKPKSMSVKGSGSVSAKKKTIRSSQMGGTNPKSSSDKQTQKSKYPNPLFSHPKQSTTPTYKYPSSSTRTPSKSILSK